MQELSRNTDIGENIWDSERKFFTGAQLKYIAMFLMLLSHLAQTNLLYNLGEKYYYIADIFVFIGRIAMPIFCFFTVEAVKHTRDFKKYLLRMLVFAIVSEIPFDLALYNQISTRSQNVIFTLMIGAISIYGLDYILKTNKKIGFKLILMILCILSTSYLAYLLKTDYSYKGVLAIILIYLGKDSKILTVINLILAFLFEFEVWGRLIPVSYGFVYLAIPLILLYNGKRGKQNKWAFYIFYPAHLLVIYLLKLLLI